MSDSISVTIEVEGVELSDTMSRVLDVFEEAAETFVRKNLDYGNSFENSAKIESILKHGEVEPDGMFDIVAKQIFVRGFMDKMSRFYSLQFNDRNNNVGEDLYDTLIDLGNYALMLAALYDKYER